MPFGSFNNLKDRVLQPSKDAAQMAKDSVHSSAIPSSPPLLPPTPSSWASLVAQQEGNTQQPVDTYRRGCDRSLLPRKD
ncbi:vesicular glutamate transporter [Plakobranchus ocellatus]|uniref:Vesicular glutamate transporter n=1 Tax=Plakobranchus ocellatus TaxID=259542 RepID=A0AAV4A206_9GAST|nr:vesicular glutamate transporter [Plakobranchus ocellatus]